MKSKPGRTKRGWLDFLGVGFHLTETKRGQHCLKGWHLLDLLEEHALHAGTSFAADSQCKNFMRPSKMAGGFWVSIPNRKNRLANLNSDVQRLAPALTDG